MEKYHGNTVEYWKRNAEENYLTTPISVLKYITVLEEQADQLQKPNVSISLPNYEYEMLIDDEGTVRCFYSDEVEELAEKIREQIRLRDNQVFAASL